MRNTVNVVLFFVLFGGIVKAQVWQWSVPLQGVISKETNAVPEAFLWIPEHCKQVKGVIFTQNNMVEEGILEHHYFRKKMAKIGFACVWVNPMYSLNFDFHNGDDIVFKTLMQELAMVSGYEELALAPIVPMGHSALASFPWNFAAGMSDRTLALVSIHGDTPQTHLTGSGTPNPDWEDRHIDGIPGLFIMGEYEWWEDRIQPAYTYIKKHPKSVITLFADAGHGHFDYSDMLVKYIADYIEMAAQHRLGKTSVLKPIQPKSGWLMDSWQLDKLPEFDAASYKRFKGNREIASWVFCKRMAIATEKYYAKARSKVKQNIGFIQDGQILKPTHAHTGFKYKFMPLADGISFKIKAFFSDSTKTKFVNSHASTPLLLDKITGPVKKVSDTVFQLHFGKLGFNNHKRSHVIWLLAHNAGDQMYKSAVQQLNMVFPLVQNEGVVQRISFPKITDQVVGTPSVPLQATSSAGLKIRYYVKKGPAVIVDDELRLTKIPPEAKFPIDVTVVAWQYGIAGKIQSAEPVIQSFKIIKK